LEFKELIGFGKVAPYLSNPFVLIGFALLALFSLYRLLIKNHIVPPIDDSAAPDIIKRMLRHGFLLTLAIIVMGFLYASFKIYTDDFEKVTTWSVSFKIGGLLAGGHFYFDTNDPTYAIGLPECRFYNLSTTQRRAIDLTLVIPTKDPEMPTITLRTETLDFLYKPPHREGLIDQPIILDPSAKLEGRIDFDVDNEVREKVMKYGGIGWLKYAEIVVYVKEHRSGKTIKVMIGESYDAASGTITRP
jgi:hypothetical protein